MAVRTVTRDSWRHQDVRRRGGGALDGGEGRMRRVSRLAMSVLGGVALAMSGVSLDAGTAGAAGNGSQGVWQVGLSFNNNGPTNGGSGGGFWGWWDFQSPANTQEAGYGGDGQAEGCVHGGGFTNGAGHSVYDIRAWYVAPDPDNNNLPTFFASWTETDRFSTGQTFTYDVTDGSTGVPAVTVHRPLLQLFGVPTPPGQSVNVQASWKPAH